MCGRTHGQPGLPVTFGFKAAVWASELARHQERLAQLRPRVEVVQLGGALGTMEFWGAQALPLLDGFAARLGLGAPDVPWITARDRTAEFLTFLALVTGTLAKIGNEVFELQRPEIGEVGEPIVAGTVGSITMPHKRNPEFSEQLDTLARVVRADADVALEGLVALHERDGRSWKAEWLVLPEACQLSGAALGFGARLLEGLRVDAARMRANLDAHGAAMTSEPLMAVLAGADRQALRARRGVRRRDGRPRRGHRPGRAARRRGAAHEGGGRRGQRPDAGPRGGRGVRGPGDGRVTGLAAQPRIRLGTLPTPLLPGAAAVGGGRRRDLAEARRPHRARAGRQQGPRAGVPARRRARARLRHPGHRRRPRLQLGDARRARRPHARARHGARLLRRPRAAGRQHAPGDDDRRRHPVHRRRGPRVRRHAGSPPWPTSCAPRAARPTRWAAAGRRRSARSATSPRPRNWRASSPTRGARRPPPGSPPARAAPRPGWWRARRGRGWARWSV